jgi:ribose-phosphate pyrophosphokinase
VGSRELLVFSGRSNPNFTEKTCESLACELGRLEVIRFSDGELSVDIGDNVRGRDVFIVQSLSMPGNDHIMELLITIDALKRSSAWRITAVMPYFGYARQDRKLKPRVPITAKLLADIITAAGAGRVLTLDLHSGQIMGFFNIPVDNLDALPVMAPYIANKYGTGQDIVIVSPDAGGVERARRYANRLGNSSIAVIDKRRSGPNMVAEMNVIGDVEGKTCVIVDDMVDTAGTLVKAVSTLLKAKATKVVASCIHGVLSGTATERLKESPLEELVISDSIALPNSKRLDKITVLSVAPLFAKAISRIHSDDSVSSLFS